MRGRLFAGGGCLLGRVFAGRRVSAARSLRQGPRGKAPAGGSLQEGLCGSVPAGGPLREGLCGTAVDVLWLEGCKCFVGQRL